MDKQSPFLLLRVPTPTKQSLSFCEATPRDLKRWIAGLPKANIGETARQLYQALVEINQLLTPSDNRLQLLELLRPEVYFVCKHLERHFLSQAIVLDERPRKVANLCQALQNHLAVGYKLIIARMAAQTGRERNQLLSIALQRASHSLCGPLIRASQLYCPVPEGLWLELHQLYQIAQDAQLQTAIIRDPLAKHTEGLSVEQTYLVALLLGCARCNQMRQSAIARLAEVLEPWSALVRLQPRKASVSLFAVAPQLDGPPRYTSLFQPSELQNALGIDPTPLVDAIKEHLEGTASSRLLVPEGFSIDMLQHLSAAWGDISERTFQRTQGQGSMTLCIGMSALHFYLAGKKPFKDVLQLPIEASPTAVFKPQTGASDIWANAFDAQKHNNWENGMPFEEIEYAKPPSDDAPTVEANGTGDSFPTFELPIVNHSPGGYCLSWPKDVPSQLQAGELLGVQDSPEQGWSVAVVRWIRQVRGGGTQMGIELIAPHAQACGLQLVRKAEQNSQYLRALLLPEISAISRPATVITPRLPFQEGNKVMINIRGVERRAVLSSRQTSTGSFSQFEYRSVEQNTVDERTPVTPAATHAPGGEEDFDSLWKSL
ncbi:MAG: molecular chaperone [Gammaproteobacteria bacterium]|nr:molecular chaperone [Gammaproteobacteria bacterium]MBU1489255.1 molecular chaperone [Gammaproteobacteria bacterium]MBU2065168.1 molecular chaperone [Gammaproteobacteria bacterium]MBU2140158.1 molecular chaperone [Gammaproteobacteria bacterium]MBU2216275.1 molecular chaperone [Gammaproteobacteria bacterium]